MDGGAAREVVIVKDGRSCVMVRSLYILVVECVGVFF